MPFDDPQVPGTIPVPSDDAPPDGYSALGVQFLISRSDRFSSFSGPAVEGFRAVDRRHPTNPCAAQICSGEVVPRLTAMHALKGVSTTGALTLLNSGPVDWIDGRQRMAMIYSAPPGGRFTFGTPYEAWQVMDMLLRPAATALREYHSRSVTHRAIRPDNLFLRDTGVPALLLGPCVGAPAGYAQPEIYEPLETAPADPAGRGNGTAKTDMFALGMTALALVLGRHPGTGMNRDALMIRRMEVGSLNAVVDRHTLPRELMDAFFGMLTDDDEDRWTAGDLDKWLNAGRPETPHMPEPLRATTAYEIAEHKVRTARSLAYVMGRHWQDAAQHLQSGALQDWVQDHAPERVAAAMLGQALIERDPASDGDDSDALRVSRAITALDPLGPVRYRDVAVDPNGLGPFLFEAARVPARKATALGVIQHGLPQRALDRRPAERRANARRSNRSSIDFARLRRWATSTLPGEGLDRCLYDLNEGLPCLSPLVGGRWVQDAEDLLTTLDALALTGQLTEPKIDPALATFIAARAGADADALVGMLKPEEADDLAITSAIRLFAEMQQSRTAQPLRGMAMWCGKLARRIAEGIHHRPTRKLLMEGIDRAVPAGSVPQVLKVVDFPELKPRDHLAFTTAKARWAQREFEIRAIRNNIEARRERAWRRGRDNVALASGFGAILIMLLTLFLDAGQ